jgi:UDP-2,3-diacylglucosamine pyrophosphatase LpxH
MGQTQIRPRLTEDEYQLIINKRKGETRNVLIIGDLHLPFEIDEYFDFIVEQYEKWNCTDVVLIGDIIDNHYSSYHETSPDGMGAGQELEIAINKLKKWYQKFPKATVIIGNHDRLVYRKAFTSGISSKWIKEYREVLEVPNWEFVEDYVLDEVLYVHGDGPTARTKMKNEMQSVVCGHRHSEQYVEFAVNPQQRIFGMQVGCGVDRTSYAMAYGKHFKKPIIGCGLVLNNGLTPIVIAAEL